MPTVLVKLFVNGESIGPYRALCDTGAQVNLMRENIMKILPTTAMPSRTLLFGIGDSAVKIHQKVEVSIQPWFEKSKSECELKAFFLVLPKTIKWSAVFPSRNISADVIDQSLINPLADPLFWRKDDVPLLLGIDVWAAMAGGKSYKVSEHIACQETLLGNVLYGRTSEITQNESDTLSEKKIVYAIDHEELYKTMQ